MGYRFLSTGVQDIYTDSRGSITQKGELPPLMARYMTGDQLWETSCSLERLSNARPLFEITTRQSYFAHYRNETAAFFLARVFDQGVTLNGLFARHLIWVGTNYGKGREVLFKDSTDFNNGVIGIGDHLQIFMAMVEYVSSSEKFNKTPLLLAMSGNNNHKPEKRLFCPCINLLAILDSHKPILSPGSLYNSLSRAQR
jgi:hypothetical protein